MIAGVGATVGRIAALAETLIEKAFPDPEDRARAEVATITAQIQGEVALLEARSQAIETELSAIIAESRHDDPYVSRARPTFLYVIYVVIAACFFGGILAVWWPEHVGIAAESITILFSAIPEELWWVFVTGYLGYTGARTFDKRNRKKAAVEVLAGIRGSSSHGTPSRN